MKVLITGGAGFIGTAVAEALLAKNIEVQPLTKGDKVQLMIRKLKCGEELARRDNHGSSNT